MTGSAWRSAISMWWLVYLAFLIPAPAFDPAAGAFEWAVTIAAIIGFAAFAVVLNVRNPSWAPHAPLLTTLFGLLVFPVNPAATVFFIYAAAYAGHWHPPRTAIRWFAGLSGLVVLLAALSPLPFPFPFQIVAFAPSLVFVWIIGMIAVSDSERHRDTEVLRAENARIEHLSTLTERERIARDLHDLLGQTLTGIVVRSQLAQRLVHRDAEAGIAEMAEVERAARAALGEVRATVSGWRQVVLDDEIASAKGALAAVDVELVVDRDEDLVLTPSAENALGLALREAVTNVVRHAHAHRCVVALREIDGQVVLEIADDGVGGSAREGNGLTGMRERIAALGGQVQRRAQGGTALVVAVPAAVAT